MFSYLAKSIQRNAKNARLTAEIIHVTPIASVAKEKTNRQSEQNATLRVS